MLRGKTVLSTLQKTYDESYLTCSTAVYYESQGNESEAMRCWKAALDRIYDHNANKVLPNYTPRSQTEMALMESLRQLELQCKERIDLLEALRISRAEDQEQQGDVVASAAADPGKPEDSSPACARLKKEKGYIGDGTIPAITYNQLSRPELPKRPTLPPRSSTEKPAKSGDTEQSSSSSSSYKTLATPPPLPSPEASHSRTSSPDRHTMRTTLRARASANKSSKATTSRRPVPAPSTPGASTAATLAWSALGLRERPGQAAVALQSSSLPDLAGLNSSDSLRKSLWDSHSRRLVSPASGAGEDPSAERRASDVGRMSPSDDRLSQRNHQPSYFSVSAASSALGSLNVKDSVGRSLIDGPDEKLPRSTASPAGGTTGAWSRDDALPGEDSDPGSRRHNSMDGRSSWRKGDGQGGVDIGSKAGQRTSAGPSTSGTDGRAVRDAKRLSNSSIDDSTGGQTRQKVNTARRKKRERHKEAPLLANLEGESSGESEDGEATTDGDSWKKRKTRVLKNLPPGVDEHAARQILNEIVVHGDEVRWSDIAGLEIAKNALRETVVYPFLRPDLFMGLREPAKGMLLFGPPGTGKTMLARAVATESKSTFFSISASSLTSKYLGESEKLVRALFVLAKVLAPSIIFVDEIDSLLSQRSDSGEHEATRRIKTEFLIQWSDLQRAAAGRETGDRDKERGDANRVLVLAATNLPWAIDEAARRRFVRRQYIPLPEAETRAVQLRTLLGQQKQTLTEADIGKLVELTEGFSGSDITALAKDAAMGPLRSLGEALLHMTMDEIRPIEFSDFVASLNTIRPSVSKAGLKEYEDWAREFGERGG